MKLKELMLQLQTQVELGNENCQVRINADHGQELMTVTYVDISYIAEDIYLPEVHLGSRKNSIKVIEIQGY
jgi:hypothetical protein